VAVVDGCQVAIAGNGEFSVGCLADGGAVGEALQQGVDGEGQGGEFGEAGVEFAVGDAIGMELLVEPGVDADFFDLAISSGVGPKVKRFSRWSMRWSGVSLRRFGLGIVTAGFSDDGAFAAG
jgi:hypothetical protein